MCRYLSDLISSKIKLLDIWQVLAEFAIDDADLIAREIQAHDVCESWVSKQLRAED